MRVQGYTLIELLVVVAIASIMAFIAIPALRDAFYRDRLSEAANIISTQVENLRRDAVREAVDFVLVIDFARSVLFSYSQDMTPEKRAEQKKKAISLPEGVRIRDLYRVGKGELNEGEAEILVSDRGYVEPVLIHLTEDEKVATVFLEPFVPKVKITFEDVQINHFLHSAGT